MFVQYNENYYPRSPDIDECAENTHSCSDVCVNTKGGYKCQSGSSSRQCIPGSTIQLSNNERFQIPGGVQECRQQVTSREGKVIKVDLSSVSLPSSSNCENYIEVLNGDSPDSVVILKYCGNGIATAVSSTPNVIITWHIESTSGNVSPGHVVFSVQNQQGEKVYTL